MFLSNTCVCCAENKIDFKHISILSIPLKKFEFHQAINEKHQNLIKFEYMTLESTILIKLIFSVDKAFSIFMDKYQSNKNSIVKELPQNAASKVIVHILAQ